MYKIAIEKSRAISFLFAKTRAFPIYYYRLQFLQRKKKKYSPFVENKRFNEAVIWYGGEDEGGGVD